MEMMLSILRAAYCQSTTITWPLMHCAKSPHGVAHGCAICSLNITRSTFKVQKIPIRDSVIFTTMSSTSPTITGVAPMNPPNNGACARSVFCAKKNGATPLTHWGFSAITSWTPFSRFIRLNHPKNPSCIGRWNGAFAAHMKPCIRWRKIHSSRYRSP